MYIYVFEFMIPCNLSCSNFVINNYFEFRFIFILSSFLTLVHIEIVLDLYMSLSLTVDLYFSIFSENRC